MQRDVRRSLGLALLLACASAGCAGRIAETQQESTYHLDAGDQLRVTIFGEEDLSGEYVVSALGDVAFPLVGDVPARGKSLDQFAADLGDRLRRGYLREPNIAVEVANFRPFHILGEVSQAGAYPYSANLTVLNAVAVAKGFSYRADRRHVYIKHAGETEERAYRLTTATPVLPGDTIRVGERHF
jgi:protein involved in polysaccharide export with SLBB domain